MGHPTHPSLEYLLVAVVAAGGCYLVTPIALRLAIKIKAIARPRDRDVHAVAIPRMGGVALLAGFGLALFTARNLPTLRDAFDAGPKMGWIVVAAALICLIGVVDDKWELDSLTKLAGQVLAAGIMVTQGGVQLAFVYIPWGDYGNVVIGQDVAIPVTILLVVVTINAMNFIDGLDGLLAGVAGIGALSFFAYSYHLGVINSTSIAAPSTLLAAALVGMCAGFLPHNFFPARIFMGDSGSMLVGLLLSAAAVLATTTSDPYAFGSGVASLPLILPLLITLAVLAIPFVDLLLAVIRRATRGQSPFSPDKQHLHHRLLELGHSHRRAVLLLYFWSALLGFSGAALAIVHGNRTLVILIGAGFLVGVLLLAVPWFRSLGRRRRDARAQRLRSRQRAGPLVDPGADTRPDSALVTSDGSDLPTDPSAAAPGARSAPRAI